MELKNYFAQDSAGNVMPGANCFLYLPGTETLATGLQSAVGADLSNPFPSASNGLIQFAAPSGDYDLRVVLGGRDYRVRVQCLDTAEQLAAAQNEVTLAAAHANSAAIAVTIADASADRAEAARDAAQASGDIYATTSVGVAATTDGQYFSVPSADANEYLILYKNNAGIATEEKRYPSVEFVETHTGTASIYETLELYSAESLIILDPDGALLLEIPDPHVSVLKESAVQVSRFETLDDVPGMYLLDASDNLMIPGVEPIQEDGDEAGTAGSLGARLAHGLTAYGDLLGPDYADWTLRNSRMRMRKLKNGEATQLSIAFFGDSYVQGGYWTQQLAKALQTAYGFAGLGFVGFQWFGTSSGTWVDGGTQPSGGGAGCSRSDLSANPVFNGLWVSDNGSGAIATPAIGDAASSAVGAYVRFSFPAGHAGADLFYHGDGTGVVRYSWDGGATWQANLSLTSTVPAKVALANVPSGAASLRIAVVSGNVKLAGVNMKSTATGVVVHKLGASGSNSSQWAAVNLGTWAAQVASLGVHLIGGLLGTNDQSSLTPQTTAANAAAIMSAIKTQSAGIDRLWVSPAENARTNDVPMIQYTSEVRKRAVDNQFAFLDLQYAFGMDVNDYKYGTALGLLESSGVHPLPASGGALISDAVLRLIAPII